MDQGDSKDASTDSLVPLYEVSEGFVGCLLFDLLLLEETTREKREGGIKGAQTTFLRTFLGTSWRGFSGSLFHRTFFGPLILSVLERAT